MAEERTLGLARARETTDEEPSKEELQRRMEEARDSISNTVTEIKDTVVNQYQSVKDTINETLDWREQFRKRPVVWSASALGLGFCVGYCLAATVKGDGADYERDRLASMKRVAPAPRPAAAAQFTHVPEDDTARSVTRPPEQKEPEGPGLIERFRETAAYDRLEREVSTLGGRFVEELSQVAQAVVLPMLIRKLTELIGIDISEKQPAKDARRLSSSEGGRDREVYGARATAPSGAGGNRAAQVDGEHRSSPTSAPRMGEAGV